MDHLTVVSLGGVLCVGGRGVGVCGFRAQEGLHVLDDAWQEAQESEIFAEASACFLFRVGGLVEGEGEGQGGACFVEVGDVVDEGVLGAGVDVAECG